MSEKLIELQRQIKQAFDPHNILNPGTIFPSLSQGSLADRPAASKL